MCCFGKPLARLLALLCVSLPQFSAVVSGAIAPYPPDVHTLHLWHLDEATNSLAAADAIAGGMTLTAIANGTTLGNTALPGFGSAASTYDAGPTATLQANPGGAPGRNAYLGPQELTGGTVDNTALSFAGTNGAFTVEALVRADFAPSALAVAPDTSRSMQIVAADGDEALRLFQLRVTWNSVNSLAPQLQFVNLNGGTQVFAAALPISGSNALVQGGWYHVAATYSGSPGQPNNLKLYWTRADTNRTTANSLASFTMSVNVASGSADWVIGNKGNSSAGISQNWCGLIDEVRLSNIARAADDFIFYEDTDNDGLPDAWELRYFGTLAYGAADDPDGDGFSNLTEWQAGSDPANRASLPGDIDGDGLPDAWEMGWWGTLDFGPADDPDGDGLSNLQEYQFHTDPTTASAATFVHNPMMSGQDPGAYFKDGYFHLVQSDGCNLHLRRATSLSGLATAANPIIWQAGCSNVWAPEIHWFNNHWYVYYSKEAQPGAERGFVIESTGTSPYGPYVDRGMLYNGFWNIDGTVLTNNTGQLYYVCSGGVTGGNQQLYIAAMTNPYTLSGTPRVLSVPDQPWEQNGLINEGPWGFNHNGQVFIVYSASGCWTDDYTLGLLKLTGLNPLSSNSWTKIGPVFTKQIGAYGPGHNSVITDATGQWWNLYHANDLSGQGCGSARNIRAQRLVWGADNLPDFGTPVPAGSWCSTDPDFLAAHFPLTESGGSTVADVASGATGIVHGQTTWAQPGLTFDGVTAYVDAGTALGNDVQHAVTLAAWVRAAQFADWAGIISKGSNAAPYALQTWSDGALRFTANWGAPSGAVGGGSWNSNFKISPNAWHHVAVTYDGANVRFYLDGVMDSNPPAATLRFGVVAEPLYLGADFPGGDEYFAGTIRDARVYGRALSLAEIRIIAGFNSPPTLDAMADAILGAGQTLLRTNIATDLEAPPQRITYQLQAAPAGAALNPVSGVLSWRPAVAQSPATNVIAVVAADNGSPSLSATQSFTVVVTAPSPPVITPAAVTNDQLEFQITGDAGPDFILENATNLATPAWRPVATNRSAVPPFLWTQPIAGPPQQFFRIRLGP